MSDPLIGLNVGFAARNAAPLASTARPVIRGAKNDKLQDGSAFKTMLSAQSLKFSQHAEQRLAQRGIKLGPEQLSAIATAVDQASAKGARDSLVLYQNMAMIVNVPSRTVITAMDDKSMQQHVFTNIDSAVVVN
ncbi:TIGR02530 family flagellar biosynthesis protein [Cohnella sp. GCM10012308]|uniref:TIGR02530 family flagellar biosynthesis protein n=1 Tax=Cohnella sp. GCM10012308 TaxID=3317329 RepID=UPI0036213607